MLIIKVIRQFMEGEKEKLIPDMSEVNFDTRLEVLLGVASKGGEITVYEEPEGEGND